MNSTPDEVLISLYLSGDQKAFEALRIRYHRRIRRFLRKKVSNYTDLEDIVQAVFVRAATRMGTVKDPRRFSTWLHRVAINAARQWQRAASRRRAAGDPVVAVIDGVMDNPQALFLEAAERLPEIYRRVVTMYYLDAKSLDDIASLEGITSSAVRKRLQRGHTLLLAALK